MAEQSTERKGLAHRIPFFYGWVIVLGAFLGSFAGGGMQSFTFGVFIKPMSESLDWSRATLVGALSVRTFITAGLAPFLGAYVDRKGPRLIMMASAILGGVACIILTQVTQIWQFYLAFILVGLAGGAGAGGVVANATVMKWFIRLRGRATAFGTMGNTAAGAILAPTAGFIIVRYGWQSGWLFLAAIFFFLLLPVTSLMVRKPEDIGLLPDGARSQAEADAARGHRRGHGTEQSWTLREALKTRALWILTLSMVVGGVGVASVVVHEFSYVSDQGFSVAVAGAVLSTHAVTASAGRLVWGFLVERFQVRYCMAALFSACALGLGILLSAGNIPQLFVFAVTYGISVGGFQVLINVAWADYFGREFVGTIRGVLTPVTTGSVALGPVLVGLGYDLSGTYVGAFTLLVGTFLTAAVIVLLATPPVKKETGVAVNT